MKFKNYQIILKEEKYMEFKYIYWKKLMMKNEKFT